MKLQSLDSLFKKSTYHDGEDRDWDSHFYGYKGLIKSAGLEIFWEEDVGSYQGDTFLILHDPDEDKWGFKCYGWGSCSGCDSWEACSNSQDAIELRDDLVTGIIWQDSKVDLVNWLQTHDWEGDYTGEKAKENGIIDRMIIALGE